MTVSSESGVLDMHLGAAIEVCFPLEHDLYGHLESFTYAPLLTAERLSEFTAAQRATEPATEFEACPQCYFQTSGTSGNAKRMPYSGVDVDRLIAATARYLLVGGVTPGDVVLNLAAPMPSMAGWAVKYGGERLGATVLNTSYLDCEPAIAGDQADRATVVVGTPLTVQNVGEEIALEHGSVHAVFPRLSTAILGGDALPMHLLRRLVELWQFEIRMLYASVETGVMAIECPHRTGMHLLPGAVVHELLPEARLRAGQPDPSIDALRPIGQCAGGDRGELVISQFDRELMPLVRYRTGDIVELCGEDCPCGLRTPRIRMLGRRLNMIELGDGVLHEMQLDRAVSEALAGTAYDEWHACVTGNGTPEAQLEVSVVADGQSFQTVASALRNALAHDPGVVVGDGQLTVRMLPTALPTPDGEDRVNRVKAQRLTFG